MITKTDWQDGEYFDVESDYNRIKNNWKYLYNLALTMFARFPIIELDDKTYSDYYFLESFNSIEENIDRIANATLKLEWFEPTRRLVENGDVWNYTDINRIERMSIAFESLFNTIFESNRLLVTGTFSTGADYTRQAIRTVK